MDAEKRSQGRRRPARGAGGSSADGTATSETLQWGLLLVGSLLFLLGIAAVGGFVGVEMFGGGPPDVGGNATDTPDDTDATDTPTTTATPTDTTTGTPPPTTEPEGTPTPTEDDDDDDPIIVIGPGTPTPTSSGAG